MGRQRSEANDAGSEKAFTAPVTEGLVAVVAIGAPGIATLEGSFLAMKWREATALPYEVLVVCVRGVSASSLATVTAWSSSNRRSGLDP